VRAVRVLPIAVTIVATIGCGSKEDATLSVYTQNPSVTASDSAFGPKTVLSGSVDVVLDLGSFSSGSATVDGVVLRLFRGTTNVVARAKIQPADGTSYPVTVSAGQKKSVHYSIALDQMSATEIADLCAGPITIGGTVQEEGTSAPLSIRSDPITPSGC